MSRIVQNRRAIIRIAFVLACIVPSLATVIISTVAFARRSADEAIEQWERDIEFQLGMSVDVARIESASDGLTLHDVSIRHPESNALIARIRQVYIVRVAERGWVVECRYPELDADRFPYIWEMLKDRLTNRRGTTDWSGTLTATNIAWRDGATIDTIPQVQCDMRHSEETSECRVAYFLEDQDPGEASTLMISRSRNILKPGVAFQWKTNSGPFPVRWLSASRPGLKRLGRDAVFNGQVDVQCGSDGTTSGSFEGSIERVNLAELVSRPFPHHVLRGLAKVDFSVLTWHDDRIATYRGKLSAINGTVSRSILNSASHVGLTAPVQLHDPLFAYRQLRLGFDGQGDKIRLFGDEARRNAVVLGATTESAMLLVATGAEADTAGLLRWMVPDSKHLVPAAHQVGALSRLFQMPSADPSSRDPFPTPALHLGTRPVRPENSEPIRPPNSE
jgi:hypothetical protein